MSSDIFARCKEYITSHALRNTMRKPGEPSRAITISRAEGARGHAISNLVRSRLDAANGHPGQPGWVVFDDALIQQVLKDNDLPLALERFMPEAHIPEIQSLIGEILHRHPSTWVLFEKTCQTILRLAAMGNVILVGRGSNILCAHMPGVIHVRLIGSESARARHIAATRGLDLETARHTLRREDKDRASYFQKHFQRDIDQPTLYDLIINTDRISDEDVANLIVSRHNTHIEGDWGDFIATL